MSIFWSFWSQLSQRLRSWFLDERQNGAPDTNGKPAEAPGTLPLTAPEVPVHDRVRWLKYGESPLLKAVREDRNLTEKQRTGAGVQCSLTKAYWCRADSKNVYIPGFRLSTGKASDDCTLRCASLNIAFASNRQAAEAKARRSRVASDGQTASLGLPCGPNITYRQPESIVGEAKGKKVSTRVNLEPHVNAGGADASLGAFGKDTERDVYTCWQFNVHFRVSEDSLEGYHDLLRMDLEIKDRESYASYARRDMVTAAILERVPDALFVAAAAEVKVSFWNPKLRFWKRLNSELSTVQEIQVIDGPDPGFACIEEVHELVSQRVHTQNSASTPSSKCTRLMECVSFGLLLMRKFE